jgi:hypothetical protein
MKKLLALSLSLLAVAPAVNATILGVRNGFPKPIYIVVVGSDYTSSSAKAARVEPGAEAIVGTAGSITGPLQFAFADDVEAAAKRAAAGKDSTYNVFETYMSSGSDPEYAALKTDAERNKFTREKAAGYGPGYGDQTFPVPWLLCHYVTLMPSSNLYYRATDGSVKLLPMVWQTYPRDQLWQNRATNPMRVKIVKAVVTESDKTSGKAEW